MSDTLANKIYLSGADITAHRFTFTRASLDTSSSQPTDYTDSLIQLVLYNDVSDTAPLVILDNDTNGGLTMHENTADTQSGVITISSAQLDTLLEGANSVDVGYVWSITPVGGAVIRKAKGEGYDGKFTIERESYAGRPSP